jgi:hypothetical protein
MSTEIKKVIVMGDVLRPWPKGDHNASGAFRNVQWLYHLIADRIKSLGLPVVAMDWNHHSMGIPYALFDVAKYYDSQGMDISVDHWVRLANRTAPCPALMQMLAAPLEGTLVVGYEMSKVQIASLDAMGVAYIDLVLHPARFAADILHGARTNSPHIHSVLQACHFDSELLHESASEIKAKVARLPKTINASWDTALLLGQVWTDRAVSRAEGGFFKIDDFKKEVLELVDRHAEVIYKPHPYEAISNQKSEIPNAVKSIKVSTINYYMLLCQPMISAVYGLNSSGLYEARFFGKPSVHLIDLQYTFHDNRSGSAIALKEFVTLSEIWLKKGFWESVLFGQGGHQFAHSKDQMTPNKLRRSMNTDWGYEQINQVVAKP